MRAFIFHVVLLCGSSLWACDNPALSLQLSAQPVFANSCLSSFAVGQTVAVQAVPTFAVQTFAVASPVFVEEVALRRRVNVQRQKVVVQKQRVQRQRVVVRSRGC